MLLQVSVYSQSKQAECTVVIRPDLQKLAKALAGGNVQTICRAFFSNSHLKDEAVSRVSRIISDECALLCSKSAHAAGIAHPLSKQRASPGNKQLLSLRPRHQLSITSFAMLLLTHPRGTS